jgi:GntR family transcriptional regulator, transcriptional repressor for pyruvate dehydrogenase complex
MERENRLSDCVADAILSMITIEKRYNPGDKLPNENQLSAELKVSRTTLREAFRVLAVSNVLEIKRGKGTFVRMDFQEGKMNDLIPLSAKADASDLYEMRLIFEPEAAYYATKRATDTELARILMLGEKIEALILAGKDRTTDEQAFHKAIAKATHNEFMNKLMPIIYEAIDKGVMLTESKKEILEYTITDHRLMMHFMKKRNAEGARDAMRIHILHAMEVLEIEKE